MSYWSLNVGFEVISADGLPLRPPFRHPNVFVKAAIEDCNFQSKIVPNTSSPQWNEYFKLYVALLHIVPVRGSHQSRKQHGAQNVLPAVAEVVPCIQHGISQDIPHMLFRD